VPHRSRPLRLIARFRQRKQRVPPLGAICDQIPRCLACPGSTGLRLEPGVGRAGHSDP
jgi:hypothetical protein